MQGCLAETRASWNSRKQWLWKTNQISGCSFMLILENCFMEIQLYNPRVFYFNKVRKFRSVCTILSNVWFFFGFVRTLSISNIVWYFLFQRSEYMETLMAWLFSFYSSCMACPLLHCHLFSHYCLTMYTSSWALWVSWYLAF